MKPEEMKKPDELNGLRQSIDAIDRDLIRLFNERMALAHRIAHVKKDSCAAIFVPAREQENIERALSQVDKRQARRADSFLRSLMRLSRSVQYEDLIEAGADFEPGRLLRETQPAWPDVRSVITQGSAGAYSEQAGAILFPQAASIRAVTWAEACDRVRDKSADVAVLPLENSTAGTVDDVYALLLKDQLYILRSLSLPIQHHLLALPGSAVETVKTVLSHPQALAQCSDFIRRQGWAVRETLNTAFAAEEVAGSGDGSLAAIASQTAAQATGLAVLRSDISNTSGNQTRFIVVGREFTVTPDAERISLILKLPHTIGSLAATLAIFSDSGLNLSKIQSRPDIDNPWTYLFYLDFECRRQDLKRALATLYQLSCEMPFLRLLGWYGEVRP
jgi:chorismate mutase/prephenate dehydratase